MSSLTESIRARLAESPYLKSVPAFSLDAFFLMRLKFDEKLQLEYSTGHRQLDALSFPLDETAARETLSEKLIQPVTSKDALAKVFGEQVINDFVVELDEKHFALLSRSIASTESHISFFQELVFVLDLFFRERVSSRKGCHVVTLDDIYWVVSSIYVFGKPYGIAVFSGNNFDKDEIRAGVGESADLARLLTGFVIQECEDLEFLRISDRILEFVRAGRSLRKAVEPAISEFFNDIPWVNVPGVNQRIPEFGHELLGSTIVTYNVPEFPSMGAEIRDILKTGTNRFHRKLAGLVDRIGGLTHSTRERLRSSVVAGIASQSLSHNIGSHALSDPRLFDPNVGADGEALRDFHQYLQGRMDFVAQLISQTPPQPEPLYFWSDLLGEFFRQRLLLNRLVADRSVEGVNLSFVIELPVSPMSSEEVIVVCENRKEAFAKLKEDCEQTRRHYIYPEENASVQVQWRQVLCVSWKEICLALGLDITSGVPVRIANGVPLAGPLEDILVAIPGGSVGRHAFYSVLENLMRNSVKYGARRGDHQNELRIHFRVRSPEIKSAQEVKCEDYWLMEIWDNFSGFYAKEEAAQYEKLVESFHQDVIDDEGNTRTSGHGLVEIKEAMRFLYDDHKDSKEKDESGVGLPWASDFAAEDADSRKASLSNVHGDIGIYDGEVSDAAVLVYRIRLRRPRLLGVWAPDLQGEAQNMAQGVFFRKDLLTNGPEETPSLSDLSPHLLVLRDPIDPSATKLMAETLALNHWRLPFRILVVAPDDGRMDAWTGLLSEWEKCAPDEGRMAKWRDELKEWEKVASDKPQPRVADPFLPRNRVRVLRANDLHGELADPLNRLDLDFVNRVYDHWLMAYKVLPKRAAPPQTEFDANNKWRMLVGFNREKQSVEDAWQMANDKQVKELQSLSVTAYFQFGEAASKSEGIAAGADDWIGKGNDDHVIYFGNHDTQPPTVNTARAAFSQEFGTKEAPRTFSLLYSPPSERKAFTFYVLGLAEAALTKIAIFDERSISMFLVDKSKDLLSGPRVDQATRAGLYSLVSVPSGSDEIMALARKEIRPNDVKASAFLIPPTIPETFLPTGASDVLVIHEGLIEELVSHSKFRQGNELSFFSRFSHIVRTSGKGREARKLDGRMPFCEYSTISTAVGPYTRDKTPKERMRIEKVILAKAVLNSLGKRD